MNKNLQQEIKSTTSTIVQISVPTTQPTSTKLMRFVTKIAARIIF